MAPAIETHSHVEYCVCGAWFFEFDKVSLMVMALQCCSHQLYLSLRSLAT